MGSRAFLRARPPFLPQPPPPPSRLSLSRSCSDTHARTHAHAHTQSRVTDSLAHTETERLVSFQVWFHLQDRTVEFYAGNEFSAKVAFCSLGNQMNCQRSSSVSPVDQISSGIGPSRPPRHLKLAWDFIQHC